MATLVVGGSGATGRLLLAQLLERNEDVRGIVRNPESLPAPLRRHPRLTLIQASLLDLSEEVLAGHVSGCAGVASCLGHNLTLKGIWGPPRRLVTDATRRLCQAIRQSSTDGPSPVRFVLMNTTGNRNRDRDEPLSVAHRLAVGLMRRLLPPQADNEEAAEYLRATIGPRHPGIEWAVVRPDGLTNEAQVTPYDLHPSPIRDAIFNPGKTSRINVAHLMAQLLCDDPTWAAWRGQMPVIYNRVT